MKRLYRLLPTSIRASRTTHRVKNFISSFLLPHDWVYDDEYYGKTARQKSAGSAPVIADSILRDLLPCRIIDVGCGTGDLLSVLRDRGCEVLGLELSKAAVEVCRERNLPVENFDLESGVALSVEPCDVAVSLEVAEHLPEHTSKRFVGFLCSLAPIVVFSAARPGQGGNDHVNEQPPEYWQARFDRQGFIPDSELTTSWRQEWKDSGLVAAWYWTNLLVYRRRRSEKPE